MTGEKANPTCAKNAQVQIAPAEMPGVEEIADLLQVLSPIGPRCRSVASRILALFAPILAEKERRDAIDREQAETARFLQHHLDNPQPPSEALRNLWADYKAAGIESVGFDSPFNACCYSEQCKAFEARALAAEAALAAERGRADMAVRQMIKQNDRLAVIRAEGE